MSRLLGIALMVVVLYGLLVGNFETARYYERRARWEGAKIYYNAVVDTLRDKPNAPYVEAALRRIDAINKRVAKTPSP